jgi:hypothetical protein
MGAGLRTIQSNARSYTNRARRDNRISQKTREAQADAAPIGVGSGGLPVGVGTEFGTAFTGRGHDQPGHPDHMRPPVDRSNTGLMPPPPFIPASGHAHGTRLPPMIPTPHVPFPGYINDTPSSVAGPSRPAAAPSDFSLPSNRPPDWPIANNRGSQ